MKKFFGKNKDASTTSKKKKAIIITIICLVLAAILAILCFFIFRPKEQEAIEGEVIQDIIDSTYGSTNQYMGVVESKAVQEIKLDGDKSVKDILVHVGDTVNKGTILFTLNTEDFDEQLQSQQLEIESYDNQIAQYQEQINQLAAERDTVSEENKFEYTTEIQSIQMDIQEAQNGKKNAAKEIAEIKKSMENACVKAEINGVVKSINEKTASDDMTESNFMVLMSSEGYRVKGIVNEQNVAKLSEGQEVILRSRVDAKKTWKGVIEKVDTDQPAKTNDDIDYSDEDTSDVVSTKYNFYVTVEENQDLLMGQHLYVELDFGNRDKDSIWLNSGYIVMEDEKHPYVYLVGKKYKVYKQEVTLGEYDEKTDEYEIKEGLNKKDTITFPLDAITEDET